MNSLVPTILCVEDETSHALLIKHALKELEIKTSFVHVFDGKAALDYIFKEGEFSDLLTSSPPALILLDLNIPKVEGLAVLQKIKTDPEHAAIPVIIMSSSNSPKEIQAAYEHHANCCLLKPQGFSGLVDMLQGIVNFWLGPHQR